MHFLKGYIATVDIDSCDGFGQSWKSLERDTI